MKKEHSYSIISSKQLTLYIVAMIAFIVIASIAGVFFVEHSKKNLIVEQNNYLTEISAKNAELIKSKIEGHTSTVAAAAGFLGDQGLLNIEQSLSTLKQEAQENGFKRMGIILPDGTAHTTDNQIGNLSERDYFKNAMEGQPSVSGRVYDIFDNKSIIVFAEPIKQDDKVIGVVYSAINVDELTKGLEIQIFNGKGNSYIVDADGVPVLDISGEAGIENFDNIFSEFLLGGSNADDIANVQKDMLEGKNEVIGLTIGGVEKKVSYSKIGINNWYSMMSVPLNIIAEGMNITIYSMIVAVGIMIFIVFVVCFFMLRYLLKKNYALEQIAYTDNVTGFSNMHRFKIEAARIMQEHPDANYAIVCFDIDKFKLINDIYGREKGDAVLTSVCKVLEQMTPDKTECFCRAVGDLYYVLSIYESEELVETRAKYLQSELKYMLKEYVVTFSFGVYAFDKANIADIQTACEWANMANKKVKTTFGKNVMFFNQEMRDKLKKEKEIENDMEHALQNNEFVLYLQPQYSYVTGEIVGGEALVRWKKDTQSMIPPDNFIPLFEANGFITKLDRYMFNNACALLKDWKEKGICQEITLSVNLSRVTIRDKKIAIELTEIAKGYGVSPQEIEIEITESAVSQGDEAIILVMESFKEQGFRLAIDDFGTGYSSLKSLKDMPADVIKFDKGFLEDAWKCARGIEIVSNLIKMVKNINMLTLAEGIESEEQGRFLSEVGCEIAQGYLYAKPMTVDEFIDRVAKQDVGIGRQNQLSHLRSEQAIKYRADKTNIEGVPVLKINMTKDTIKLVEGAHNKVFENAGITKYSYFWKHYYNNVIDKEYTDVDCDKYNIESILRNYYSGVKTFKQDFLRKSEDKNTQTWVRITAVFNKEEGTGDVVGLIYIKNNNEEKVREMDLLYKGTHDSLTGLLSKAVAKEKIEAILLETNSKNDKHALMLLDLSCVDVISQNFGRAFADAVLARTAEKIKLLFRDMDVISRIGEYQFAIFACNVRSRSSLEIKAVDLSKEINEVYTKNGIDYKITCSIGIAVYPINGNGFDAIYKNADSALCEAKANDKDKYVFYNDKMTHKISGIKDIDEETVMNHKSFDEDIVNHVFRIIYESDDKQEAVNTVLELIGKHFKVSRAYVFEDDKNGNGVSNTFEWCDKGVEPFIEHLQNLTAEEIGNYKKRFNKDGFWFLTDIDNEDEMVNKILKPQGIRSMAHFAIVKNGRICGLIGFDICNDKISTLQEGIFKLRKISNVLGMFIIEMRQSKTDADIKKIANSIIDHINSCAYIVNSSTFELLAINKAALELVPSAKLGQRCVDVFWDGDCGLCPAKQMMETDKPTMSIEKFNKKFNKWFKIKASALELQDGVKSCLLECIDITKEKEL